MVARCPRAAEALRITFLLPTFICLFLGSANHTSQTPPQCQVSRVWGGEVLLQINTSSSGKEVRVVEWFFIAKDGKEYVIGEFEDGKLKWLNPTDRFGKRLELLGESVLRIKDLRLDDSGTYKALAKLTTAETEAYLFILNVHEPVPEPKILPHLISKGPEGCNLTLRCQAAGKQEFKVSWKRELMALEEISGQHRIFNNGSDLHLFWQPTFSDSTFTCWVSNPVDQKNASIALVSICSNEGQVGARNTWYRLIPLAVFAVACLFVCLWLWKKRKKPAAKAEFCITTEEDQNPPGPHYAEIWKNKSPPEADDQDHDLLPSCLDHGSSAKPQTVYVTVQASADIPGRESPVVEPAFLKPKFVRV